jgi:hypothetical protein
MKQRLAIGQIGVLGLPATALETRAFENRGTAPLEFLVVGVARDMNMKNDPLATLPQRLGGPGAGRGDGL